MATDIRDLTIMRSPDNAIETYRQPQAIVEQATQQANVLMKVVNDKRLFAIINDRKYLTAEAWEIIATFNNAHAVPRTVEPIKDGDVTIGYRAQVDIYQRGEIVSSGIMSCGFEEFPCRGKEGMAKHRAAESAAQTWALAKAARMKFAWVAVLAGYEPTPAEEMTGDAAKQDANNPYWCREHKTLWFKRGRMASFGHPVEGSKEWCHMPKQPAHDLDVATDKVADAPQDDRPPLAPTGATSAKEEFEALIPYATSIGVTPPTVSPHVLPIVYEQILPGFKAAIAQKERI